MSCIKLRAVFVEDGALVEGSNMLGSLRANVVSDVVKCDHAEAAAQLYAQHMNCNIVVFIGEDFANGNMTAFATIQEMRKNERCRPEPAIFLRIPVTEQDCDYIRMGRNYCIDHLTLCTSLKAMLKFRPKGSVAMSAAQQQPAHSLTRILVVDDVTANCLGMKLQLQLVDKKWRIDCVRSAEVAALTFLSYDAIVMDEQLEDLMMSGSEAISYIRQQEMALQCTKTVIIASWSTTSLPVEGADYVWDKRVEKPTIAKDLARLVHC